LKYGEETEIGVKNCAPYNKSSEAGWPPLAAGADPYPSRSAGTFPHRVRPRPSLDAHRLTVAVDASEAANTLAAPWCDIAQPLYHGRQLLGCHHQLTSLW